MSTSCNDWISKNIMANWAKKQVKRITCINQKGFGNHRNRGSCVGIAFIQHFFPINQFERTMINVTNKFLQLEIKKSISMTFRRTQRYLDDTNDSSCDSGKLNVGICHIYYIHWNVRYCHYHYSALLQFNPKKKKILLTIA